mgnify:CR=1 FL=1
MRGGAGLPGVSGGDHPAAAPDGQIVLHSYTGLRLPSVCLRQQEDGTLGVYCAQGSFSRFKPVDMVYQGDDYVLVSVPQNTDGLDTLRPGDEVIMTGVTLDGSQILTGD